MDGVFISLFVFKMDTPNLIPSPAGSVFKVPKKNDQNQILKITSESLHENLIVLNLNLLFKSRSKINFLGQTVLAFLDLRLESGLIFS